MNKRNKKYPNIHKELIDNCRKGNRDAQFEIYKLYYQAMFNTCMRIVNNSQEAEDIMQESFLKAFSNISQYKEEVSFGAWLKRIVINHSLDYLRKTKTLFENLEDLKSEPASDIEINEEEDLKLKAGKVREEIMKLPEGYRLVLSLYLIEGYDHNEIARILNISSSTSRSQFVRARKKLIENLKSKNNG